MVKTVFDYHDYKRYLSDRIESMPNHGRGERTRLADALKCHMAYISQVFNGPADLSLEQADILNEYFGHTSEEGDFFLLLVQEERAGTKSLKERFKSQRKSLLEQRQLLKKRLQFTDILPLETQLTYYSAWYFSAIHFCVGIPKYRTREKLSEYLQLPLPTVTKALEFLVSAGLISEKGKHYERKIDRVQVPIDSPMNIKNHTHWRLMGLNSIELNRNEDLHSSTVITVSESDALAIREVFVKAIEEVRRITKPSKDEKLCCYTVDFFEVGDRLRSKESNPSRSFKNTFSENPELRGVLS